MMGSSLSTAWKVGLSLVVLLALIGWALDWEAMKIGRQGELRIQSLASSRQNNRYYSKSDMNTINPGELPGYTGWARPAKTLAPFFVIETVSTESTVRVDESFVVTVHCQEHEDCSKGSALFYLRAYGPAVVPGIVLNFQPTSESSGRYVMEFTFFDPGIYTVEVVLSFSTSPPLDSFPEIQPEEEPSYEGYLLPGFPLLVPVTQPAVTSTELRQQQQLSATVKQGHLCSLHDLTISSSADARNKARWVVTGKSNGLGYATNRTLDDTVSERGYIANVNSIGIHMEYRYRSNCHLLPESSFHRDLHEQRVFAQCPNKIQIIYIGDSVMRGQMDLLRSLTEGVSTIELQILPLFGGYRKNQIVGPSNVQSFLDEIQLKYPNDVKAILFNTGLHDVHQLCAVELDDNRRTYLNHSLLDSGSFTCSAEYRSLLQEFVGTIQKFPAQLKVFQTSTAAWPKYGNWGVGWEANAQRMPLVSDFCNMFNDIAFEVLHDLDDTTIHIMDGYWITYSRPDNREFGTLGKKLSHPGIEVFSTMVRIWAKMISDQVC